MKTKPKILAVNKKGESRSDVSLDETVLHMNNGDILRVLDQDTTLKQKIFEYKSNDVYSITLVFE